MIAPNNFGAGSSFAFGDVVDLFRPCSTGRRQEAGRKQESRKKTRKQEECDEGQKPEEGSPMHKEFQEASVGLVLMSEQTKQRQPAIYQ